MVDLFRTGTILKIAKRISKHGTEWHKLIYIFRKMKNIKVWDVIPVWICCIVTVTIVLQYNLTKEILSQKKLDKSSVEILNTFYTGNWFTLGLGMVTIAITIWLGLNIFNITSNSRLMQIEAKYNELAFMSKAYIDIIKNDFLRDLEWLAERYPTYQLFLKYFKQEELLIEIDKASKYYSYLGRITRNIRSIAEAYEGNLYDAALELCETNLDDGKEDIVEALETEERNLYINLIECDGWFYKVACQLRSTNGGDFTDNDIEKLKSFVDLCDKLIKKFFNKDFDNNIRANILNTIGYTYELIMQVCEKMGVKEQKRMDYLGDCLRYYKELFDDFKTDSISPKKLARYYHNYSIAERRYAKNNGTSYDKAKKLLKDTFEKDRFDYKAYVLYGDLLLEEVNEEIDKNIAIDKLTEAIRFFKFSIMISPTFTDAYDKILEALNKLAELEQNDMINEEIMYYKSFLGRTNQK